MRDPLRFVELPIDESERPPAFQQQIRRAVHLRRQLGGEEIERLHDLVGVSQRIDLQVGHDEVAGHPHSHRKCLMDRLADFQHVFHGQFEHVAEIALVINQRVDLPVIEQQHPPRLTQVLQRCPPLGKESEHPVGVVFTLGVGVAMDGQQAGSLRIAARQGVLMVNLEPVPFAHAAILRPDGSEVKPAAEMLGQDRTGLGRRCEDATANPRDAGIGDIEQPRRNDLDQRGDDPPQSAEPLHDVEDRLRLDERPAVGGPHDDAVGQVFRSSSGMAARNASLSSGAKRNVLPARSSARTNRTARWQRPQWPS